MLGAISPLLKAQLPDSNRAEINWPEIKWPDSPERNQGQSVVEIAMRVGRQGFHRVAMANPCSGYHMVCGVPVWLAGKTLSANRLPLA